MAYANGKIPTSATVALTTAPGQRLEPTAARQWDALARSVQNVHGWLPVLTDSYRPYDVQERIFRDRYRQGNHRGKAGFTTDVRYWGGQPWTRRSGTAAAAVPGTSNHGWAKAVDVSGLGGFNGTRFKQLAALAARFGYSNAEGRSVNEPWHWVFVGAYTVTNPISGGGSVTVPTLPVTVPTLPGGIPTAPAKDWFTMATVSDLTSALKSVLDTSWFRNMVYNTVWAFPRWTVPGTDRKENPGQYVSATRVLAVQAVTEARQAKELAKAAAEGIRLTEDEIASLSTRIAAQVAEETKNLTVEDIVSRVSVDLSVKE